jgi:lipopolysaccharide/colanic/teichoic acid biosynthesis glycosyltransferase
MTATVADVAVESPVPVFVGATHDHSTVLVALKSTVDRVLALLALVALAVPLAGIALAIRLTSRGPALYRQVRLGHHGREFPMWKFRTMLSGSAGPAPLTSDGDGLLFKIRRDPRVTPIGRFLRTWSLDELPQLVNIVRGEMSFVGPRPLPVTLDELAVHERRRLLMKPGLTGLWQVSGRSDLSWEDCVRLDLHYVDCWSVTLDLRILGLTAVAVLRRAGAY